MSYNDKVKEILKEKKIDIGLNSKEEFQADIHGNADNAKEVGYYLLAKVAKSLDAGALPSQEYFYRAMSFSEAKCWIDAWAKKDLVEELEYVLRDKQKGVHFASGADYAKKYITKESKEEIVLEFYAPKLVKRFEKIGVGRKNESNGEMSYGIGYKETIILNPTKEINDKIEEKYQAYKKDSVIEKLREWWGIPEECSLEDKRRLLKVFYFLKVMETIRIVYIKNS